MFECVRMNNQIKCIVPVWQIVNIDARVIAINMATNFSQVFGQCAGLIDFERPERVE